MIAKSPAFCHCSEQIQTVGDFDSGLRHEDPSRIRYAIDAFGFAGKHDVCGAGRTESPPLCNINT